MFDDSLILIIPVYNEEKTIHRVINEWDKELGDIVQNYHIHIFNDGSKDGTEEILKGKLSSNARLTCHHQRNKGHGPTILAAYKTFPDVEWIFQTDSDGEVLAKDFTRLWEKRDDHDLLLGKRTDRKGSITRRLISTVGRYTLRFLAQSKIDDPNVPFRLIRCQKFNDHLFKMPSNTFAPNVIVSGIASMEGMRIFQAEISYKDREFGTVSIKRLKLLRAAILSFYQIVKFFLQYRNTQKRPESRELL